MPAGALDDAGSDRVTGGKVDGILEHPALGDSVRLPATVRANDFLWLQVRAQRTPMRGMWKPGRLIVTVGPEGNRAAAVAALLMQDGEPHPQLLSLVNGKDPLYYAPFTPAKEWRATERLVGVNFKRAPIDKLSQPPEKITIESIAVLRRVHAEPVEMSLAAPNAASRMLILGTGM